MFGLAKIASKHVGVRGLVGGQRYASSLVVAEQVDGKLSDQTLSVITAAKKIGGEVTVLVAGSKAADVAGQVAKVDGVAKVLAANDAAYDHSVAENVTGLVQAIQGEKSFSHILFAATNEGKNIAPRLAAKLDVAALSDVIEVVGEDTFKRPMYAGNAIATCKVSQPCTVVTVRTTAFDKAAEGGSAATEEVSGPGDASLAKWVADEVVKSDRPELTAADTVIAGGRGMKNGENFQMLYDLADKFPGGAAVGASRAAVDAGYVPNELQIGQTGKVIAPQLYIGVGISGAIQHLAGMKDSKTIVCINTDPEAPIFQVSDLGLQEDLFKAVPEMTQKL